jgi:hypothetical protein
MTSNKRLFLPIKSKKGLGYFGYATSGFNEGFLVLLEEEREIGS